MAELPQELDVNDYEERTEWTPMPEGEYDAIIIDSEFKANSKGTGQYLLVTIEVTKGDYAGRQLKEYLNLVNPSQTAVKIAEDKMKEIGRAVGLENVSNSTQVHNRPFVIKVKVEEAKPYTDKDGNERTGSPQNKITSFKKSAFPGEGSAPAAKEAGWK